MALITSVTILPLNPRQTSIAATAPSSGTTQALLPRGRFYSPVNRRFTPNGTTSFRTELQRAGYPEGRVTLSSVDLIMRPMELRGQGALPQHRAPFVPTHQAAKADTPFAVWPSRPSLFWKTAHYNHSILPRPATREACVCESELEGSQRRPSPLP